MLLLQEPKSDLVYNDVNFDVTYKGYQSWSRTYFMNILRIFDDHHMWHQN